MKRQRERHQGKKKERETTRTLLKRTIPKNKTGQKRQRGEIQNTAAGEGGEETLSAEKKKAKRHFPDTLEKQIEQVIDRGIETQEEQGRQQRNDMMEEEENNEQTTNDDRHASKEGKENRKLNKKKKYLIVKKKTT